MHKWRSFNWLRVGEWLLYRRWLLVGSASLCVFIFESLEYGLFLHGVSSSFFFEMLFYGAFLPLSVGIALSWAASRVELAWSLYYQNLNRNLAIQIHNAHSENRLAAMMLRFFQTVMPLAGATLYVYEQSTHRYRTILDWPHDESGGDPNLTLECRADNCPLLSINAGAEATTLHACRSAKASSVDSHFFCTPFLFSDKPIIAARLSYIAGHAPSSEQERLLKESSPMIASAFRRVQLEQLVRKRDNSIKTEQDRIARDVHDTLGHSLAYLRLRLDQISMEIDQAPTNTLRHEVEALRDVAKEAYDQMREVLIALSPNVESRISNTLLNYADKISHRSNFELNVYQHGTPRILAPLVQRNIFYIFQETLTNIEKHAHACKVEVHLRWEDAYFEVQVMDDGVGYDSASQISNGHFGVNNMRERALESNAQFTIQSLPDHGTKLKLRVPYEDET